MNQSLLGPVVVVVALALLASSAAAHALPRLKVSDNKRFLVTADGKPFFYLGDTAWELFHRLSREEAEVYLKNRAERGFNVIQTVALAERDGLREPNPYGHVPLRDNDPTKINEEYFQHVDWIVNRANELGMYIGFLPTWGDKWNMKRTTDGPEIFTVANAEIYGEFLGRRYKDKGIIWILGGDRIIDEDHHKPIIRAMARGLRKGDGGAHLMTFHPRGGETSAQYFHDEDWLDFNMRQNGHGIEFAVHYAKIAQDYARTPVKPVIDGEPAYEDHPVSFKPGELGRSVAADVRRCFYWDVFGGAFGHTYGHHSVWQMWEPKHAPVNGPLMTWREALEQPGAAQMIHGRRLIESRPFLTRIPDDSIIVPADVADSVPGAGTRRFVATRDTEGTYAMVYVPVGRKFSVRMDVIRGEQVKAWWFDPRDGSARGIGEFSNQGTRELVPPNPGELLDWVLVLDDASRGYDAPGKH